MNFSCYSCVRGDYVKLFLHLETRGEVNEYTPWTGLLCGQRQDVPHVLYSSGPGLVFEFHTDHQQKNSNGFKGTFRFLDKRQYQTDGQKLPGTMCDHQFVSSDYAPSHGKFYSPRYPSSYPKNIRCSYRFRARLKERIRIVFEEVTLEKGDLSCINRADLIRVHDGRSSSSPTIKMLCNTVTEIEILSTGNELYIEFVANSEWPGQGFKATFQFQPIDEISGAQDKDRSKSRPSITMAGPAVSATMLVPTAFTQKTTTTPLTKPTQTPIISSEPYTVVSLEITTAKLARVEQPRVKLCPKASSCDAIFNSDTSKNGTISSPNYPLPYSARSQCRYDFQGRGKERVQVIFSDFNLFHPTENPTECDSVDALMAFVHIDGRMEKIDSFCGSSLPKPIMSNGPRLMLEFRGLHSSRYSTGFKATYSFTENFGVTTGHQLTEFPCAFVFNSNDSRNGSFASPNYPGFYPRNTECHYFFHGQPKERVHIHFTYFDVEGVLPCEAVSASDYLEFSNFMARDRKYARHCGQLKEFDIQSDRKFFRVTFRSNDRLDGTGFHANFRFTDEVEITTQKPELMNNASLLNFHSYSAYGIKLLIVYFLRFLN